MNIAKDKKDHIAKDRAHVEAVIDYVRGRPHSIGPEDVQAVGLVQDRLHNEIMIGHLVAIETALLLLLPGGVKPEPEPVPGTLTDPNPVVSSTPGAPFPGGLAMLQAADAAYDQTKSVPENFVAMLQAVMRLTQYADVWGLRAGEPEHE